MSKVQGYTFCL